MSYNLVQDVLLHLLHARGLLGRERLTDHLEAAGLHLAGGLGHVLEELVWKDYSLNVPQALPHGWRHVVLAKDLILRLQRGQHLQQPFLVGYVGGVHPCEVEVLGGAGIPDLGGDDLLEGRLDVVLDPDIFDFGSPVLASQDAEEHDLVDGRRLQVGLVEAVPLGEVVEVVQAHHVLGELLAGQLGAGGLGLHAKQIGIKLRLRILKTPNYIVKSAT